MNKIQEKYPKPHPQTAGRVIDGEAVLILSDNSEVNVLNLVGSRVFELSDGTHKIADIINTIASEYEVSAEQAEKDIITFLQQMVKQQVMVLSDTKEA